MKKLDFYILKKLLATFVYVVLMIVAIVLIIDLTEKNDNFIKHNLPFQPIFRYYLSFIPFVASLITPINTFIAVVFVTSKLAVRTEIIAMLSSGISFQRLMRPYLIGSVIIAIGSFVLNGWVIPNANEYRISFENAYVRKPSYSSTRDVHMKIGENTYMYMGNFISRRNVGDNFTLEKIEDNVLKEKLFASRIKWDTASEKWTLQNYQIRRINGFEEEFESGTSLDTSLVITPRDFGENYGMNETLTLTEMNGYIEELRKRGADNVTTYLIEKYIRYMSPFALIVLSFIGLIMSARKVRGGSGLQIAIGFLIAFIYIIFFILSRAIAEGSTMNPMIAVWIPNFIFTLVGIFLYRIVPK